MQPMPQQLLLLLMHNSPYNNPCLHNTIFYMQHMVSNYELGAC